MLESINNLLSKFWETEDCCNVKTSVYNAEEREALLMENSLRNELAIATKLIALGSVKQVNFQTMLMPR